MSAWGDLPETLEVNGTEHPINADFRDVLDLIAQLSNPDRDMSINAFVALSLFFDDFDALPETDYAEAVQVMFQFINGGDPVEEDGQRVPKTIDWERDRQMIIADVNKVAGCEIRALPFCHWWTFLGWFNGIGEGQLSTVVAIREKLRKRKKLDEWERDYCDRNRSKVYLERRYTPREEEIFDAWMV